MGSIFLLLLFAFFCNAQEPTDYTFDDAFMFGVSTAAYQVEGAWNLSGKGENIWDRLTHTRPHLVLDNANGDIACATYHKTETDVELLAELGVHFYRFSISWSRILPTGQVNNINEAGIQYYNDLINALIDKGIIPLVTMFHWDLPQPLQELGGWPNPILANYFAQYADLLFNRFGDRVKYWLTFNEPFVFCHAGYNYGYLAPMYAQNGYGGYLCGHTVLLAHGKAFEIYDTKYRDIQNGKVGITIDTTWYEPASDSQEDIDAAERIMQMNFGWFAHPIYSVEGDYPAIMRERIDALSYGRSRLPRFTDEEIELLRNSADFFGLNHYAAEACTVAEEGSYAVPSVTGDIGTSCYIPDHWEATSVRAITPWGFRKLLNWIKEEYNNPNVIVTENGYSDITGDLEDCGRIDFYNRYLQALLEAINEDGCNVFGYSAWSFLDNFEWTLGYSQKYGLIHVDFEDTDRPRTRKMSFYAYKNIINTRKIDSDFSPNGWPTCSDENTFPTEFLFGVSSAAYQVEGAWDTAGKGASIWDTAIHDKPETVIDGTNADIACDAYNHVEEDVQLLKNLGVNFYRFSISWPRILPNGKIDNINPDGIRYYNELIDELIANEIIPMVTMNHFDLPQALQDEGGFLNESFVDYFEDYAGILYKNFGDRVKYWMTFNEPSAVCENGYGTGDLPPYGYNPGVGGYQCGRIVLLAHARAYHLYNDNYKESFGGRVGINLNSVWYEPLTTSDEDIAITELNLQVSLGWLAHPIFSEDGDYPPTMRERIDYLSTQQGFTESRLPEFTQQEIDTIKGSADIFGINYYTSRLCTVSEDENTEPSHSGDGGASCSLDTTGESTGLEWLTVTPWGLKNLLNWVKDEYNNPDVIIFENGYPENNINREDCRRIYYHNAHLEAVQEAISEDDCNVIGYSAWSFMDSFEWFYGYMVRFGLYSVDFDEPDRTRTSKMSTDVYKNIIGTRKID